MNYNKQLMQDLAAKLTDEGYRVFIAERDTHGFYTNQEGSCVVSFQVDLGMVTYSGNYKSQHSGTGWRFDDYMRHADMLAARPPEWVRERGLKLTTMAQHLKTYQNSSKFAEFKPTAKEVLP